MNRNRHVLAALAISIYFGGCGTVPSGVSPLSEGLYSRVGDTTCPASDTNGATSQIALFSVLHVGPNGIPVQGGVEAFVGQTDEGAFGPYTLSLTVKSVAITPDGVILTSDIRLHPTTADNSDSDLIGTATASFKTSGPNTIRYQVSTVTGSASGYGLFWECDALYRR